MVVTAAVKAIRKISILVIDDDSVEHHLVHRYLGITDGWEPELTFATSGAVALRILERRPVEIVLLNYHLGGENGLNLLTKIRDVNPSSAIIMMTGQGDEELAAGAMKAGALDYLPKGQLTPEGLQRAILKATEERDLRRKVAEQQKLLENLARHDELTGLFNRRALLEALSSEAARARRYEGSLCLLMLDIDHFKNVNDTHGHIAGDVALAASAKVIADNIRDTDIAGRYGGEEFCIILPESDISSARRIAQRIHKNIAENSFAGPGGEEFRVTCSIGVAEYIRKLEDAQGLLERADRALYQAKEDGRNRISFS